MRSLSTACGLVVFLLTAASGQTTVPAEADLKTGTMADTETIAMWRILKSQGYASPSELREKVREKLLTEDRLPHRFQRVELAGVGSTDDTGETLPNMIDKQLKTSNFNEHFPEQQSIVDFYSVRKHVTGALNGIYTFFGKDLRESISDTRGIPSARSQYILDQLKNAKINELFAHSWGTEVVYLGIMNGSIIPPKKLVVMGVPDSNQEKWRILAAYTGIEVHVIGFEWDKARIAGEAVMKFKSGLPKDTSSLQKLWDEKCGARAGTITACADPSKFVQKNFDYNLHVVPPDGPKDTFVKETVRRAMDHDRLLYYTYLSKRNLFNETVAQLEAPQLKIIKAEESRILAEAMAESRRLIAQARAQVEIEHREHDERLKRTYVDMAIRSCAIPGSVTQTELNSLPDPYQENLQTSSRLPRGLDDCAISVYLRLGRGVDAEGIRRHSTPTAPIDVNPDPSLPQPARPIRAPVAAVPMIPFNSTFPRLKDIAETACASPAKAALGTHELQPSFPYSFNTKLDDEVAARLSANLGDCPRQLFYKLIEMIRSGKGPAVNNQWLRDMAAQYSTPVYIAPSRGRQVDPPCSEQNGVWGCPK